MMKKVKPIQRSREELTIENSVLRELLHDIREKSSTHTPPLIKMPVPIQQSSTPMAEVVAVEKTVQPQTSSIKPKKRMFGLWFFVCIILYVASMACLYYGLSHYLGMSGFALISILAVVTILYAFFMGLVMSKKESPIGTVSSAALLGTPHMETESVPILECPLCNKKIYKSAVQDTEQGYTQFIKCLNPMCVFQKTITLKP